MRTKTQSQNASGRQASGQPSHAPEIALIVILGVMVLLRILDICAPAAPENSGCAIIHTGRAVVSCATRDN